MYTVPLFDTFIDLDSTENEEDEIICQGRGRQLERRVPRLPHLAFIIKKKIEEDELVKGKRKRGRGRASIFRPLPMNSIEDPGRHGVFQGHNTSSSNSLVKESFEAAENYGYSFNGNETADQDGNTNAKPRCELRKQMDEIKQRLSKEIREKERLHHKVNFAEINKQMFSELASTIQDKAFHKPTRVMPLTISNLNKHERDSEDVLQKAVTTSRSSVVTMDKETPLYERYGVTHEDIWLLKENRFKMPAVVKQKVNMHNELAKLADGLALEFVDKPKLGNHMENSQTSDLSINVDSEHQQNVNVNVESGDKQNVNVDTAHKQNLNMNFDSDIEQNEIVNVDSANKQIDNVYVDSSHEQNVNYLKELFDEDSWSNQKELSNYSNEEFKGTNDSDVDYLKEGTKVKETESVNIDKDFGDEKCDGAVDFTKHKVNIAVGEDIIDSSYYEKQSSVLYNLHTDADIAHVDTNGLPTDYASETSSQLSDSFDMGVSGDADMEVTEIYANPTANFIKESIENCENIDQLKEHSSETVNFKTKEVVQSETDTSSSKLTGDNVIHTNEESKEIVESDLSNSKDELEENFENIILYSDSPNTGDDIPSTEKNNENINKAKVLKNITPSTISLMDEFDNPSINEDVDRTLVADTLEGFQVVKKKHRKKRSVSPRQPKGKPRVKPDNTIWRLYGSNVIQVDGLPRECDTCELHSMVSGFGTIQDYQVKVVNDNSMIRFRLPDEDSCDYAVACLNGIEDQNCVLTCFKLRY